VLGREARIVRARLAPVGEGVEVFDHRYVATGNNELNSPPPLTGDRNERNP
jgi:hypothetical protein